MVEAQTVAVACKCNSCNNEMQCYYTQYCINKEIGWERESSCGPDGRSVAASHFGPPPEDIRNIIIQRYGMWEVWIENGAQVTVVLKVLKQEMKFSNDELKATIKKIPGVILKGTKVEMEWSAYLLRLSGIECVVVKEDAPTPI